MSPHPTLKGLLMNARFRKLAAVLAGAVVAGPATAIEFDIGGLTTTINNKASVGAQMRVESRDSDLIGIANGGTANTTASFSTNADDGNLAWDSGELTSAAIKLTSDLAVSRGNFGLFVRGSGLYNPVMHGKDYFNEADYNPSTPTREFGQDQREYKNATIQGHNGLDFDLLDAYVFGRFDLMDRGLNIKVGRQVLNWGESTFVQHGLNALVTADVNQLRVPGFEIEEVQVPVGMAVVSMDVIRNVTAEGFYQFEWQPTVIDATGTLLSTNDVAGIGATDANLGFGRAYQNQTASVAADPTTWCLPPPALAAGVGSPCVPFGSTVPRGPDADAEDGDQYGGKIGMFVPFLNDMDLSLYAAKYHSRLPLLSGVSRTGPTTSARTASYFVEYPEDIKIYGLSFNTTVEWLDVAVQGEYSLKVDQPLQLDDVELLLAGLGAAGQISPLPGATLGNQYLRGWRRKDVDQMDIGLTKIIGPHLGFDQMTVLFEAAYMHVRDMESPEVLAYDAPTTSTLNAGTAALNASTAFGLPVTPYSNYATSSSWGYKIAARETYNNVFGILTVEPTILFQHDVDGISPTPISNFLENRKQINAILGLNYLQAWSFDLGYSMFFGGGSQNLLTDRDYVDFAVKYSF
jgi:hypothetical protein